MKKLIYAVIPLLAVAFVFAGCAKTEPKADESAAVAAVKCECKCAKDGAFTCETKDVKDGMCKCPKCGKMVKCACAPAAAPAKDAKKVPATTTAPAKSTAKAAVPVKK